MNRPRAAFSLLEVMVVLALVGVLVAMTLEAMLGARAYADTGEQQDELHREAERILAVMHDDLGSSGWYFPGDKALTATTFSEDRAGTRAVRYYPHINQPSTQSDDEITAGGMLQAAPYLTRPRSYASNISQRSDDLLPASLPGQAGDITLRPSESGYATSFFAPSQELVFLRTFYAANTASATAAIASWVPAPAVNTSIATERPNATRHRPVLSFGSIGSSSAAWSTPNNHAAIGVLQPSQYKYNASGGVVPRNAGTGDAGKPYGVLLDSAWLDLADNRPQLKVLWDTMSSADLFVDPGASATVNGESEQDPLSLREYVYALVPCPAKVAYGTGRLVRAVRVARTDTAYSPISTIGVQVGQRISNVRSVVRNGAIWRMCWVIEEVISDNVARVLFSTRRHNPNLAVNQVQVQLFLARRKDDRSKGHVSLVVSQALTMRARLGPEDIAADAAKLGDAIPFSF